MPTIPGVIDTFQKLTALHKKKNDDYSGDFGPFFNFEFCDYVSSLFKGSRDKVYAVFMAVKIARLAVVLYNPANNEAAEDSFDDMILYGAIWKSDYISRKTKNHISDLHTVRETLKS